MHFQACISQRSGRFLVKLIRRNSALDTFFYDTFEVDDAHTIHTHNPICLCLTLQNNNGGQHPFCIHCPIYNCCIA